MRKDWSRCGLPLSPNVPDVKLTERLFGYSFLESAFGRILLREEEKFIDENFEFKADIEFIDDHENYIEDGEFEKREHVRDTSEIKDETYFREFNDWRERGFRLWGIYPSATENSLIVKAWLSEIHILRNEFKERSVDLPF